MKTSIAVTKADIRKEIIESLSIVITKGCRDILSDYHSRAECNPKIGGNSSDVVVLLNLDYIGPAFVTYDQLGCSAAYGREYEESTVFVLNDSVSPQDFIECALGGLNEILARKTQAKKLDALVKSQLKLKL